MDEQLEKQWWTNGWMRAAAGVFLLIIAFSIIFFMMNKSSVLSIEEDRLTVSTVEKGVFREFIQVTGNLQPASSNFLDAVEGGVIESIMIPSGTTVSAGDTILTLSNSNLRLQVLQQSSSLYDQINQARNSRLNTEQNTLSLKERLAQAENRYRVTGANFKRIDTLYSQQLVSEQTYTEARENYMYQKKRYNLIYESFKQDSIKSEQQLLQIDQSLERMQQSLTAVQGILDRLAVKAPISGQLSTADLTVGQSIASGERIGQIDQLDSYNVRVLIDEYNLSRITKGLKGTSVIDSEEYTLEIEKVFPIVENGRFEVDMKFSGKAPENLRRGQTLRIRLELGNSSPALLLERGAFYQETGGNWVFEISDDGNLATRQAIRLGRQNPDYFEVISGVNAGDRVITSSYESFGDREKLNLK